MAAVEAPAVPTVVWRERVDDHLERLATHMERQDARLERQDERLEHQDERLERQDTRLEQLTKHVAQLDTRLVRVEATLPHLATKADVANVINALTWRLAGHRGRRPDSTGGVPQADRRLTGHPRCGPGARVPPYGPPAAAGGTARVGARMTAGERL